MNQPIDTDNPTPLPTEVERGTSRCPRCGFQPPPQLADFAECPACGVVVAKFLAAQRRQAEQTPNLDEDRGDAGGQDTIYGGDLPDEAVGQDEGERGDEKPEWVPPKTFSQLRREQEARPHTDGIDREFKIGVALGVGLWVVPFVRPLFAYLSVLVHEIGHTATGWLFGYPTIPSFDFVNHGGVSVFFFRLESLTFVVAAVLLLWIWQARQYRRIQVIAAITLALYLLLTWTPLHRLAFDIMGHGGELLFATIFLYRGLRPSYRFDSLERPAWAAAGTFVTLHHLGFAFVLATSAQRQQQYLHGMRGFRHDLHRLVDWSGVPLTLIAALLTVLAALPPLLAWLWHRRAGVWRQKLLVLLGVAAEDR